MGLGVYSDHQLKRFIEEGIIFSQGEPIDTGKEGEAKGQLDSSSLNLRLGEEMHAMRYSSIPEGSIADHIRNASQYSFSIDSKAGGFLHKGVIYLAELQENLNLQHYLEGKANPKSSIGRVDAHVRVLTEGGTKFDVINPGYKGKLFLEIYPQSFDLRVFPGQELAQLRIKDRQVGFLSDEQLRTLDDITHPGLLTDGGERAKGHYIENDSLALRLSLKGKNPIAISRQDAPPVDLSADGTLPFSEYFDRITPKNKSLEFALQNGNFYLLHTEKPTKIPLDHCGELVDIKTESGEYRVHYAGFFQPGFWDTAVLEFRNSGPNFLVRDGQKIANLWVFPLSQLAKHAYEGIYKGQSKFQGVKGAKFFDMTK